MSAVTAYAARIVKPKKAKVNPFAGVETGVFNPLNPNKGLPAPAAPSAPDAQTVAPVQATIPPVGASSNPQAFDPNAYKLSPDYVGGADDAQKVHDLGITALGKADEYGQVDLGNRIRDLAAAQVKSTDTAQNSANKAGLFYSSFLTKNLNDLRSQYGDQEAAAREGERRAIEDRNGQRGSLDAQLGSTLHQLALAAVANQTQQDATEHAPNYGSGLGANGNFAGVDYQNGTPQGAPTAASVLASKSLLHTGIDGAYVASQKKKAKK